MSFRVTFDDSARDFVLAAFGKTSRDGFIVEQCNTKQRVLNPRGEDIPTDEFAGIRKGSTIFVKSDIVSLIEAAQAIDARP